MNISFGKKIPIGYCQIQNNKTGKFELATINEYDCKTKEDAQEVRNLGNDWLFASSIAFEMECKNDSYNKNKHNNYHYFNIESKDGEILGIAGCEESEDCFSVNYLETKQDKRHRFVGQTLLARLAALTLTMKKCKFQINGAIETAKDFYGRVCGFTSQGFGTYTKKAEKIPIFIKQTEYKTQGPIIKLGV